MKYLVLVLVSVMVFAEDKLPDTIPVILNHPQPTVIFVAQPQRLPISEGTKTHLDIEKNAWVECPCQQKTRENEREKCLLVYQKYIQDLWDGKAFEKDHDLIKKLTTECLQKVDNKKKKQLGVK